MTGTDERPGHERPGYGRFGTATPGVRPAPPSIEGLLTAQQPQPGRRRPRPRRIVAIAGVLAVAAGGWAAGRYAFTSPPSPRLTQLVVTSAALPAGIRLSGADLRVVSVQPGAAVPPGAVSPAAASGLIGLVTTGAVPAGTFLTGSLVTPGGALPGRHQALVGLALKAGQLPTGGLSPGQQVLVVETPVNSQGQPAPQQVTTTTVWNLQGPDGSGTTLASVIVPYQMATRLAGFAAAGQVALIATAPAAGGDSGTGSGPAIGGQRTGSAPSGSGARSSGHGGSTARSHPSRSKH